MSRRPHEALKADYVIVGGGSAGAVLANRLSEDPTVRVALVEAGGEAKALLVQIPVGVVRLVGHDRYDWRYEQAPDASINGRHFLWSGGRLLGGGSSINGQVYIRGTRQDFDRWAEVGCAGWGFDEVMPYFLRSEHWWGEPNQVHGQHGPLSVSPMRAPHPLCQTFLEGCRQIGLPTLAEYNGGDMEGAFLTVTSQRNGWRCSTEKAYLRPVRSRPNLEVLTHAEVETIRFAEGRATGVTFLRGGVRQTLDAAREVIVSAGAMGSPALLMRSGVGPGAELQAAGIPLVRESAGVGQNLQEHCSAAQTRPVNRPTLNSEVGPLHALGHAARFLWNRTGPLTSPAVQAMGLARTRDDLEEPDVQLHFLPLKRSIAAADKGDRFKVRLSKEPGITVTASACRPYSRGRVALNPDRRPRVIHELLGDPRDVDTLVGGMKLVERLLKTPAFGAVIPNDRSTSKPDRSDDQWAEHVRARCLPAYHAAGTCRMGSDAAAVVDPQLRVKGVEGLRVIDASVMPTLPSANTNAPTIMIGEKAAELIRAAAR